MSDPVPPDNRDDEANRLSGRLGRYARVGTNIGGFAARVAGARLLGRELDRDKNAADLARALGGLKGPIMKIAQMLSTIPDAVPPEYAEELAQLQSQAPAMGWPFVKRRMKAELGTDWRGKFATFEREAAASASLGQVHRATSHDAQPLACKLQYPDMQSAVEADLSQLGIAFSIYKRMDPAIDTSEMLQEISERLREELDYDLEARHIALYGGIFDGDPLVHVPAVHHGLSTGRLLTMDWMEGDPLVSFAGAPLEERNRIARAMFRAWWYPFSHFGVIHGDPHLGNYTVRTEADGTVSGINLLDYGCIRTFQLQFVGGVLDLYHGVLDDDRARIVHAYEAWGFENLTNDLIDVLTIWARFIFDPLLEDRVRRVAQDVAPGEYGRKEAFTVHQGLKKHGPIRIPREFVFMDRAAIGLGGVFLRLDAELNYFRIYNELIENFSLIDVEARQRAAFDAAGVPVPSDSA